MTTLKRDALIVLIAMAILAGAALITHHIPTGVRFDEHLLWKAQHDGP